MVLHSFISRTQKVQCAVRRAQEVGDGEAEGEGEFLYETVVCPEWHLLKGTSKNSTIGR